MAETGGGSGEKVGGIYYEVDLDTKKLIEAQKNVDAALQNVSVKMTETAKAASAYAHQAGIASKYTKELEAEAKKLGMTAGQLSNAMRILPAQFTDIAVSLASGQNPMMVFLQQGGQLKDMFGSVGAASRALAGYVAGLVNPFTVAAAAAGVVIYTMLQGGEETLAFRRALELTGNQSGVTADQLLFLAESMDNMAGVTQAKASEALGIFANLGIRGKDQLEKFTKSAINLEKAGGPSIEATAKAFAELGKAPLAASIKLNESTNFLTKSTYEQIKALEDSGRKTEAARVAQDAYSNTLDERTPKILENLGYIQRAWRGIVGITKEAGEEILDIGRDKSREQKLKDLKDGYEYQKGANPIAARSLLSQIQNIENEINQEQRNLDKKVSESEAVRLKIDRDKAREKYADKFASNSEKAKKEIDTARKEGVLTPELEAKIKAQYQSKFSSGEYMQGLASKSETDPLKKIEEETKQLIEKNKKLLADGSISREQAAQAEVLIEQKKQNQIAEIEEKRLSESNAIRISLMKDGEAKIEATRIEALRRIAVEEEKSVITSEQAALRRVKAESDAAKERLRIIGAVNPVEALRLEYEAKLQIVRDYESLMAKAGVDSTEQAQAAKTAITSQYELQRTALAEQSFRSQGEAQMFLMNSLNALSQTATSSIMGLINGTMSAKDAMRGLANTVLNEAVSSLVRIGMQQVKNALLADTIAAADKARAVTNGAAYAASVDAQVAGMSALAAQNAYAATAAIPIIGPDLAPAAAKTAATAAALIGAPAVSTAPLAGGRLYGGAVSSDKMYRVNENGRPEMFTASNGRQYMMPNTRGEVTPANEIGGGNVQFSVSIVNNYSSAGVSVNQRDDGRMVEITINEIASQISNNSGPVWTAMRGATNIEGRM